MPEREAELSARITERRGRYKLTLRATNPNAISILEELTDPGFGDDYERYLTLDVASSLSSSDGLEVEFRLSREEKESTERSLRRILGEPPQIPPTE